MTRVPIDWFDHFETFWQQCPKRPRGCANPKDVAKRKYRIALQKGTSIEDMQRAAELWRMSAPEPSEYTPMVSTWLNQRRYMDVLEADRQQQLRSVGAEREAHYRRRQKDIPPEPTPEERQRVAAKAKRLVSDVLSYMSPISEAEQQRGRELARKREQWKRVRANLRHEAAGR